MAPSFNVSNPSGFFEFTPQQETVYQEWLGVIREIFTKYGFPPITTPLVEREANLLGKGGNPKEIYRLQRVAEEAKDISHNGNALRFDQTVPLALYIARHQNELQFPFKRSVIGPVFRGERPQKGRFRQFDQCDIDIVGNEKLSLIHDGVIPAITIEVFEKLLPKNDFLVRINNRKLVSGFLEILDLDLEKTQAVIKIIDDLEKIPRSKIITLLEDCVGDKNLAKTILETFGAQKSIESLFLWGEAIMAKNQNTTLFSEGLSELKLVIKTLQSLGADKKRYQIDLTVMRGLDYYTGTVYETTLLGYESLGSICSGGRYEDLASVFTGKKMPGVGISIGITRLLSQLFSEKIIEPQGRKAPDILILPAGNEPDLVQACFPIAQKIRADESLGKNLCVEVYLESKNLGKKMEYANHMGVDQVIIVGEDEIASGEFRMKDMKSGEKKAFKLSPNQVL